jgi:hypothetical protein
VGVNWPFGIYRLLSAPGRNSLKFQRSSFGVYRINRLPAKRFDGKSDGKNSFAILFLIFTVKLRVKLLKSLQITEFFALQIVRLGNS